MPAVALGARRALPALVALLAGLARAQEPPTAADRERTWTMVQEAMLLESLDGDPRASARRWEQLVRTELPDGDPSLGEALFALARVRWSMGDVQGARDALDRCVRSSALRARCTDLRAQLDLEVDGVHAVPVRWTFDSPDHGFFHPRAWWDKGSIRIAPLGRDEGTVLAWTTRVDALKDDVLVVGFHEPTPRPAVIRFRVRSLQLPALLGLELEDVYGRHYAPQPASIQVPASRGWLPVTVPLLDAVALDGDAPLDPALLYRFVLRDRTALLGEAGRNELQIDDFEVR